MASAADRFKAVVVVDSLLYPLFSIQKGYINFVAKSIRRPSVRHVSCKFIIS